MHVARLLIEHGADVAARTKDGSTSLHSASSKGRVDVVQFLIEHGADVAATTKDGWTSLHRASSRGHVDVAQFLFESMAPTSQPGPRTGGHRCMRRPGGVTCMWHGFSLSMAPTWQPGLRTGRHRYRCIVRPREFTWRWRSSSSNTAAAPIQQQQRPSTIRNFNTAQVKLHHDRRSSYYATSYHPWVYALDSMECM